MCFTFENQFNGQHKWMWRRDESKKMVSEKLQPNKQKHKYKVVWKVHKRVKTTERKGTKIRTETLWVVVVEVA